MFFLTPRHVKHGRQFIKDARKLLAYKRDLVSPEVANEVEGEIVALEKAVDSRDKAAIENQAQKLDQVCGKLTRPMPDAAWRENVEVFLVAIVIALAVRTYFLQPFTIPTGSMQPTLNGINFYDQTEPPPNFLVRGLQAAAFGRNWINIVAEADETIINIRSFNSLLPFVGYTPVIPFGFFARTELISDKGNRYVISEARETVERQLRRTFGVQFHRGEPILRGYFDTGDHVFVDKFTYHFRAPHRAEVFVFNTQKLPTIESRNNPNASSQFYIKRLAGLPGDQLRIDEPNLYVNGKLAEEPQFRRVMSGTPQSPNHGYAGYANGFPSFLLPIMRTPEDVYPVPPKHYFALGDNSYHSSDSRDWGPVPEQNLMGRGVLVYWPFTSHFGLIH